MAVRYLSCETLVCERKYELFERGNDEILCYEKDSARLGDKIRFLVRNKNEKEKIVLGRWDIPDGARSMEFLKMSFGVGDNIEYVVGAPVYYDSGGNLLKIGNR